MTQSKREEGSRTALRARTYVVVESIWQMCCEQFRHQDFSNAFWPEYSKTLAQCIMSAAELDKTKQNILCQAIVTACRS
jgi:hypothetical protein